MGAGSDKASSNDDLTRALMLVTDIPRSKGRETGANIGHALRRDLPGFDPHKLGYSSLSQLLFEAADDLVVIDRKGDDRVWALGEFVSDRDIEHALGPEAETEDKVALETSAVPTRIDLVNFDRAAMYVWSWPPLDSQCSLVRMVQGNPLYSTVVLTYHLLLAIASECGEA